MSKPTKTKKAKPTVDFNLSTANDPFEFEVDKKILAEFKEKNLAHRWISRASLVQNRGDHRGWVPYKTEVKKNTAAGSLDFQYGIDPEGYISKKDLVLAVRPNEVHQTSKRRIAARTAAKEGGYNSQAAAKLKEITGGSMKVLEGYDDEVSGYKTQGEEEFGDEE